LDIGKLQDCKGHFGAKVAELFAENLSLYEKGKKLKFLVDMEQGY